ncbi:hypothetical protein LHJ74_09335 [Streptomyces sp. N2-109]|uniref:WXG100 family type VII secretion target n=1 Tax=Streptomyces gossypii TaxID=2883101 RepID=A0ABT2JQS8_9ACTN|nr:hypothetical protein [Streptomyces gossypii]MCT2590111.1 hypothetical protein [Streptomyces gossypii]
MSADGDLNISPTSLDLITKGLNAAMGELKEIGTSTGALQGSGFESMAMTGMEAGGGGLADNFEDYCERWEWGVRALVQDANAIAQRLGLAAGMIWSEDQYWDGTFKIGVNSLVGNPHATEEEVTQQNWGGLLTPDAPDYSGESWDQAGQDIEQDWKDTGRALLTEGRGGDQAEQMNDALGIDQERFDQMVDDVYGPSPEERAAQEGTG